MYWSPLRSPKVCVKHSMSWKSSVTSQAETVKRQATIQRNGQKDTRLQRRNNEKDIRSKKDKTTEEESKYKDEDGTPNTRGRETKLK